MCNKSCSLSEKENLACSDTEQLLDDYLDECLCPNIKAKVDSHLSSCECCSNLYDDCKKIRAVARELSNKKIPEDVHTRLMQALSEKVGLKLENQSKAQLSLIKN